MLFIISILGISWLCYCFLINKIMNVNNREQPELLNPKLKENMAKVTPVPIVPLKK